MGTLPSYNVVYGDYCVAIDASLATVRSRNDKGRWQAFSHIPVVIWTRKNGSDVTPIKVLQIGAACSVAVEVPSMIGFMEPISLRVDIAARAEQYLHSQNVLDEQRSAIPMLFVLSLPSRGLLPGDKSGQRKCLAGLSAFCPGRKRCSTSSVDFGGSVAGRIAKFCPSTFIGSPL